MHRKGFTPTEWYLRSPVREVCSSRARLCVLEKSRDGFGFHVDMDEARAAHVVWFVERGSAAQSGGLRAGDAILAVNGRDARTLSHTEMVDAIQESGWRMKLLVCEFRTESMPNLDGLGLTGDVVELALSLQANPAQSGRRLSVELAANPHHGQGLRVETDAMHGRRRCSLDMLASPLGADGTAARPVIRRFSQQLPSSPLFSLVLPMAPLKENKSSGGLVKEGTSEGPEEHGASLHDPGEARVGHMKKSASVGSFLQTFSVQPYPARHGLCQNEGTSVTEAGESKAKRTISTPVEASAEADPPANPQIPPADPPIPPADPPIPPDAGDEASGREPPPDESREHGAVEGGASAARRAGAAEGGARPEGSVERQPARRCSVAETAADDDGGPPGGCENPPSVCGESQEDREPGDKGGSWQPMLCGFLCSFCLNCTVARGMTFGDKQRFEVE